MTIIRYRPMELRFTGETEIPLVQSREFERSTKYYYITKGRFGVVGKGTKVPKPDWPYESERACLVAMAEGCMRKEKTLQNRLEDNRELSKEIADRLEVLRKGDEHE